MGRGTKANGGYTAAQAAALKVLSAAKEAGGEVRTAPSGDGQATLSGITAKSLESRGLAKITSKDGEQRVTLTRAGTTAVRSLTSA